MNTTLLKRYPLLPVFFLLAFSTLVSITSCAHKEDDLTTMEQNAVNDLELFAKDLTSNPIYLEFLNNKLDAIMELNIVLASMPEESAAEFRNYGESIAAGLEVFDNEKAQALLNLSPEDEEYLTAASTKLIESSARFNDFLAKQQVSETDQNQVFEIISSSETNRTLLFNNLQNFESYDIVSKNRRCNRSFRWCIAGDIMVTGLLAGTGCTAALSGGPFAVFACLGADSVLFSRLSSACYSSWSRCMRRSNPAGAA